jgi:signal transduction histidine kinase
MGSSSRRLGRAVAAGGDGSVREGSSDRAPQWRTPLDRLFAAAVVVSLVATALVLLQNTLGHVVMPAADLVLDTTAFVVCMALTVLAWSRFRENRVIAAVYHAAAFGVLACAYGSALVVSLLHSGSIDALAEPVNVQVLVFAVSLLAAALLFVLAGSLTARSTYGWRPQWVLVAPSLGVLCVLVVGVLQDPPPEPLQMVSFVEGSPLPHATPFGALVHIATAILFLMGAFVSRRLWHKEGVVIDGWIAVGLVFAGFGELLWTLYPSAHPGQVSTGDLFRLACFLSLLIGLESAVRTGLHDLRVANTELADLRDVEVERAALEERTRLARDLHDGLAQDLWLAKLRIGELASRDDLSVEARRAAESGLAAIDIGLGGAREAVATLRSPEHADSGFCNLVQRTVEDYGDRFGLRVEFRFEGDHTTRIAPRTQAEILRITQEALTNAARHADASVVGVRLGIRHDRITLRVVDNGRGFDPTQVGPNSFGLVSMRERAATISGRLRVVSRVGDGTRVVLTAPFTRTAAPFARPGAHAEAENR